MFQVFSVRKTLNQANVTSVRQKQTNFTRESLQTKNKHSLKTCQSDVCAFLRVFNLSIYLSTIFTHSIYLFIQLICKTVLEKVAS